MQKTLLLSKLLRAQKSTLQIVLLTPKVWSFHPVFSERLPFADVLCKKIWKEKSEVPLKDKIIYQATSRIY